MFALQLLGGLSLLGTDGQPLGRGSQRKRLALLAVLARAPRRTATRDRLIGLLWPECPTDEARHRLSSAIYDLRRTLGAEALASHGDDLTLASPLIVDTERFEAAAAAGRWREALARYPGPFLDGVHLDDAEEFERWVDGERDRLERLLRRASEAVDAAAGMPHPAAPASPPAPSPPGRLDHTRRTLRRPATVALLLCAVLILGWAISRRALPADPSGVVRIAVLPFRVIGPVPIPNLSHGIVDLLSLELDGAGNIRAVDPGAILAGADTGHAYADRAGRNLARKLGADRYVLGAVQGSVDRIRIRATMYHARTGEVEAESFAEGAPEQLLALVGRVGAALLAGQFRTSGEHLTRMGAGATASLPALKAWLAGELAFRRGSYEVAAAAFEEATRYDSSFALAHYRHSLATLWGDRPGASTDRHDSLALRHAATLAPRERQLLDAYAAWRAGDAGLAEYRYRRVLSLWPDDVEAWQQLGETFFHYNPLRGRPVAEARESFQRVLALDPGHRGAEWHLALLHALEGRSQEFQRGLERVVNISSGNSANGAEARALLRQTRPSPVRDSVFEAGDENSLSALAWRLAVYVGDLDGAAQLSRKLIQPGRNEFARLLGHLYLAHLAAARGRLREAVAEIHRAPSAGPDLDPGLGVAGMLARWGPGFSRSERLAVRDSLRRNPPAWNALSAPDVTYVTALLDLQLGDVTAAHAGIARLNRLSVDSVPRRHLVSALLALEAAQGGRHLETLRLLPDNRPLGWFGLAVSGDVRADPMLRFVRAEALFALGRHDEAFGWYQSLGEHALRDLIYLAPSHFRRGQILERQGRVAEARKHFAAVVTLWADADPELQPMVSEARARLGGRLAQHVVPPQTEPR